MPRLAGGVTLVGEYEGSGYREPHYLARLPSGALVQLTRLLHDVAEACDGRRDHAAIAERVTSTYGKEVSADNVRELVAKLRPLGVVADPEHPEPPPTIDPLLALKFRTTLLGPEATRRLVRPLAPLFVPPVIALVGLGLVAFDSWLFFVHGLGEGIRATVAQPVVFLAVGALVVVSALFHEFGHAGACHYSGGRPGRMGAGVYIAWPAFYTDVTDAYRLDRKGRLRTDLGGIYFNAIVVLACAGAYLASGYEPLLFVCFLLQVQVLQQMLPLLRLDGYYVLADAVGVPDLFRRTGPILRSVLPGRRTEREVRELTPRARWIVTCWTLAVVPLLLVNLAWLLLQAPRVAATAWDSAAHYVGVVQDGVGLTRAVAVVQLLVLLVPVVGITVTVLRTGTRGVSGAFRWSRGSASRRLVVVVGLAGVAGLLALAWWPDARLSPYREGERGTLLQAVRDVRYAGTGDPLLRSPNEAQSDLPPVPDGGSGVAVVAGEEQPVTTRDAGTGPADSPGGATGGDPEPSASPVADTDQPAPSATPAPEATTDPAPSPSPEVTP